MTNDTPAAGARTNYLNVSFTIRSWLLTTDHKRIALLYLIAVTLFFFSAMAAAIFLHLERLTPQADLAGSDALARVFTWHGQLAVFFVLLPAIPAVLGNFVLPLTIGTGNVAFPRLNLLAWYVYIAGGIAMLWVAAAGGAPTGWVFDVPGSASSPELNLIPSAAAVLAALTSAGLNALNLAATIHRKRVAAMNWLRLPLFVWALYTASLALALTAPLLAASLIGSVLSRLGTSFHGANTPPDWSMSLGHAAAVVSLLPAFGIVCEVVAAFSRRRIYGYRTLVGYMAAFALLAVFGSASPIAFGDAAPAFSLLGSLGWMAPLVMTFHWLATMYRASIAPRAALFFGLGSVMLLAAGAPAALFLAFPALGDYLSGTLFKSAEFHYLFAGEALAFLGGLHYWWPKIAGRLYPEAWARVSAVLLVASGHLAWGPQLLLGWLGMPSRAGEYAESFHLWNVLSAVGALFFAAAITLPVIYLLWSLRYGPPAPANPWGAEGLEWRCPSPPPVDNFGQPPAIP